MTLRPAGRVPRLLALVAVVVAVLGVGVPGVAAASTDVAADRVLVVGVPGLTWDDVDRDRTPQLAELAAGSPIGAMSVRAARSTSCVLDGWATVGAGNRAGFPEPNGAADPATQDDTSGAAPAGDRTGRTPVGGTAAPVPSCQWQEQRAASGVGDPVAAGPQIAADPATARFGAQPGALARAVGCAAVAGGGAQTAAAGPGIALTTAAGLPAGRAGLTQLLAACPLALVSLDALTRGEDRDAELRDVDDAVGRLRAAVGGLPGRTLLLLAGISETGDGTPRLHVALAIGPGFSGSRWLTSASTGRSPYVQLIDVAPTALRALGTDVPASMNGQPMQADGQRPGLEESVDRLGRADVAATVHNRTVGPFFWLLVGLAAALLAAGLLVLGGWRIGRWGPAAPRAAGRGARAALETAALLLAALPVATFLAGLVPWERSARPTAALAGAVVLADLVVAGLAAAGPWRRHRLGPPLGIVLATLATLVLDVVTGSTLELDGLLGYDPIVAGRFTGLGNLASALVSVTALLATTALAAALARRSARPRAVTAATVVAAGLVTVAVIGAPGVGRDFGGVLATLPGFLLLAMLLTRTRVTPGRLVGVLGAGVVAVGTLAYLDWLRPAAERSHLGRFVEQLRTGEAWTVVSRKGAANVGILLHSPLSWLLPVALVAAAWLLRPGGLLRGGAGGLGPADRAAVRAGLAACALTLAVGAAVNDSGVAVPAAAAALLVPLLVGLAAGRPSADDVAADAGAARRSDAPFGGGAPGGGRVTVRSRESTVWNA